MERLFRGRAVNGMFFPDDERAYRAALIDWPRAVVFVRLEDEERVHTRQQEKFWHGAVVPFFEELWMIEMGWAARPPKGTVHGALVRACFGTVETPLGEERRSSAGFTLREYSLLIDWAKEYALDKYPKARFPEPETA